MSLASELFRHYLEYLTAPAVLLTLSLVLAPLCYGLYDTTAIAEAQTLPGLVPGCRRLGSSDRRPLSPSNSIGKSQKPRVRAIYTYPIDGCKGVRVPASEVTSTGLKYDGSFTFAQLRSEQPPADGTSEPSTQWQHSWRAISANDNPRLEFIDLEIWVPDPRQAPVKISNGHTKMTSDDTTVFGMQKPRSRSRQGTLVMESAGQEIDRLRKYSVPAVESDFAANGGCLVIRFPFSPDHNVLGLRTETVTITIPLQPTEERAEVKGYNDEELSYDGETVHALDLSSEIEPAAIEKLQYFLGSSKPLALFLTSTDGPEPIELDGVLPNERRSPEKLRRGLLRVASQMDSGSSQEERPNMMLEGLDKPLPSGRQTLGFGRCITPFDSRGGRGRSVAREDTSVAQYTVITDKGSLYLKPDFNYGIVRVGDLVEG